MTLRIAPARCSCCYVHAYIKSSYHISDRSNWISGGLFLACPFRGKSEIFAGSLFSRNFKHRRFWSSCREGWKGLANRPWCPSLFTLSCWARRGRPSKPTPVIFCPRNVKKSFILGTQSTDQWCMWCSTWLGPSRWALETDFVSNPPSLMLTLGRRPKTCARLSRHAKIVAMLLPSTENGSWSRTTPGCNFRAS